MPPDGSLNQESFTEAKVDIAVLKNRMETLEASVREGQEMMRVIHQQLLDVQNQLAAARGGWRMLMMLGGAGATLGAALTWTVQHMSFAPIK